MHAMLLVAALAMGGGPHHAAGGMFPILHPYHGNSGFPYRSCARCRGCEGQPYDYRIEFDYPWKMSPLPLGPPMSLDYDELSLRRGTPGGGPRVSSQSPPRSVRLARRAPARSAALNRPLQTSRSFKSR